MNIIPYLLVPQVFFSLLLGLCVISAWVIFIFSAQEKRLSVKLSEKEATLKKEISSSNELDKEVKNLRNESARLKGELSLAKQMYDGLKGQYDELENSMERLARESEEKKILNYDKSKMPTKAANSGPDAGLKPL